MKIHLLIALLTLTACEVRVEVPQQEKTVVATPPVEAITTPTLNKAAPEVETKACPALLSLNRLPNTTFSKSTYWKCISQCDQVPFSAIAFQMNYAMVATYGWTTAWLEMPNGQPHYLLSNMEDHNPFEANNSRLHLGTPYNAGGPSNVDYPVSVNCDQIVINGAVFEYKVAI